MNARSTVTSIAIVVLAVGTAAYAYLVDRGTVSDSDRAGRRTDVFPSFRVAEVSRVELVHGQESLVLERDADAGGASTWSMTSPRRERADPAAVDMLLRELELATRLREVGANDAAGLDAPRASGKITVGKLEYRFAVGGDAPRPEGAAYMRIDGEGTFVVDRALKVQLLRGADAYRDRTLLAYGASGIARVEVRSAGSSFALEREGATFRVAGKGLRASRAAVDRVMAALANGRAESFVDDAAADRSTATPAFTIAVTPRDAAKERVELRIGGECPGQPADVVIVRTAPTRISACTARALVEALGTTAAALVDASPFFAHADEMEELRIEPLGREGPRVEAARRGMGWHERSPEDRELTSDETDSANVLALALAQARGTDVRHAGADEHFEPRARVTVVRTGGGTTEVVEVGATGSDGTALVHRGDDGALLRVTRAVARRFAPHPVALRARSLWQAPFDAASVVAMEDTCGPTGQRLELRNRAWVMRTPAGLPADAVSVADLLGTVAHAKADAWLTEVDDGGFGFDGPGACTVTLTLDGTASPTDAGSRRVTIAFGAEGDGSDGGFYARTLDEPAVFLASAGLREALAHPAIDRSRFRLDAGAGVAVAVVHDGVRHLVSADAGEDRLAVAIAGLYAQAALHAGPAGADEGLGHPALEIVATTRVDGGALVETHIVVGAETEVDGAAAYFARAAGLDATFAVPKARVTAILDAL